MSTDVFEQTSSSSICGKYKPQTLMKLRQSCQAMQIMQEF